MWTKEQMLKILKSRLIQISLNEMGLGPIFVRKSNQEVVYEKIVNVFLSINENKSHLLLKHKLIELLIKFFLLSPNIKHVNTIVTFHHPHRAIS